MFACLQMGGWTPDDIGRVWEKVPTETPPARSMINAILRLRIDGRPLFRSVESADGSRAIQFDPAEFPDGMNAICGALWLRLIELLRMPLTREELRWSNGKTMPTASAPGSPSWRAASRSRRPGRPSTDAAVPAEPKKDAMTSEKRETAIDALLRAVRRWRQAEAWLTAGVPPEDSPHGAGNGCRWIEIDDERFTEDDIVWLRRSAVISSISSVEGRTGWNQWPDACDRIEGPRPPERIDEMRMRLHTDADTPHYLYCAVASDGPALPVGGCQLRTFREGGDAAPPNDATTDVRASADESDDLDWLAALAATESLPDTRELPDRTPRGAQPRRAPTT